MFFYYYVSHFLQCITQFFCTGQMAAPMETYVTNADTLVVAVPTIVLVTPLPTVGVMGCVCCVVWCSVGVCCCTQWCCCRRWYCWDWCCVSTALIVYWVSSYMCSVTYVYIVIWYGVLADLFFGNRNKIRSKVLVNYYTKVFSCESFYITFHLLNIYAICTILLHRSDGPSDWNIRHQCRHTSRSSGYHIKRA